MVHLHALRGRGRLQAYVLRIYRRRRPHHAVAILYPNFALAASCNCLHERGELRLAEAFDRQPFHIADVGELGSRCGGQGTFFILPFGLCPVKESEVLACLVP